MKSKKNNSSRINRKKILEKELKKIGEKINVLSESIKTLRKEGKDLFDQQIKLKQVKSSIGVFEEMSSKKSLHQIKQNLKNIEKELVRIKKQRNKDIIKEYYTQP